MSKDFTPGKGAVPARRNSVLPAVVWFGRKTVSEVRRLSISLIAGLLGSLAAMLVMGLLRLNWGTPTLPELAGNRVLLLLPANQFVSLLLRFQPHPKTGPLALALLGQFILGIVLGPVFHLAARAPERVRGRWPRRRTWITGGVFVVVMEVVTLVLFWPVLPGGLYGDPVGRARALTSLAALLTFLAAVLVLLLADHWLYGVFGAWAVPIAVSARAEAQAVEGLPTATIVNPQEAGAQRGGAPSVSRRGALLAGGVVVVGVAASVAGIERIIDTYLARAATYDGFNTPASVTSAITPTRDFYIVTQNVIDPSVRLQRWELQVTGLVQHARSWNFEQLVRLPAETRPITLECISNEVGAHLMSTAVWTGVGLQTLLDEAGGVQADAKWVVFRGVDGYFTSLPLADLLAVRTLVAWHMNGSALPERHGYPLRVVVPGRYGEQSPKWLTQIEVVTSEVKGLYESQGWSYAPLATTSRIDTPTSSVGLSAVSVAGIAFAGTRGIQRVQVSADGGTNWNDATLETPLSAQTWVLWRWQWTPPATGHYTLVVRATDGTGAVQTSQQRGTVPDGATGWDVVKVEVR